MMDPDGNSDFPQDMRLLAATAGNGSLDTGQVISDSDPFGSPVGERGRLTKNLCDTPAAAVAGGSTGSGSRGTQPLNSQMSSNGTQSIPAWQCQVQECLRVFTTKAGLGQHVRRQHPAEYNASIDTSRKKARWCDEEKLRLAALEERLEREGLARKERGGAVKGINEQMTANFTGRTFDAIKSRRKNPEHRQMVEEARKRWRESALSTETRPVSPGESSPDCDPIVVGRGLPGARGKKGRKSPTECSGTSLNVSAADSDASAGEREEGDEVVKKSLPDLSIHRPVTRAQAQTKELTRDAAQTEELTGAAALDMELTNDQTVPGEDLDNAVQALAADLALDVYGGEVLRSLAQRSCAGEEIKEDLERYLEQYLARKLTFAPVAKPPRNEKKRKGGKRKQRRAEYARVQSLYQKSRLRCAQEILDGQQKNIVADHQGFIDFWRKTMTECPPGPPLDVSSPTETLGEIWVPITRDDVKGNLPPCSTATGPDGMTARELRGVPLSHLALILNLIMKIGEVPRNLAVSRTTFIPKVPEASRPEDFRPIAVAPNLMRMFHKILASRVQRKVSLDVRQRAFIPADGCGENVAILQALLTESRRLLRPLHLATMDLRKAFDSVSVDAVLSAAKAVGLPHGLLHYLEDLYESSCTLLHSGEIKESVRAARGVKQGDPLSPLLFNLVVDQLLRELPPIIGFKLGETTINAMAFADDLTLVASTRAGLQQLLDQAEAFFKARGLRFNPSKSSTLSLVPSGRQKKMKVEQLPFCVEGADIPVLSCVASWKYLGVTFDTRGRKVPLMGELAPLLERLSSAPLKPQQRLVLLKHYLLPRFYHKGTFAHLTSKALRRLDTRLRTEIRKWLRLPHDTPVGYFHAPVEEGGLGIPALRHMLPRLKMNRIAMLRMSDVPACGDAVKCPAIIHEERKATSLLTVNGAVLRTAKDVTSHWAAVLHSSVDGGHLKGCAAVPQAHAWVSDGTRLLSGRDFVDCAKLRIGAIPTLARSSRGQEKDVSCRAGCRKPETLSHVVQQCHRTHGARIKRHDGIVAYLCRKFHKDGWTVEREPCIKTKQGRRFPDIVIRKQDRSAIVDVQIVGTATPLDVAHRRKQAYYSENEEVVAYVKPVHDHAPLVTSCTLSYRGVWSGRSRTDLRGLGITNSDAKLMSVRTLQGTLAVYGCFRRTTSRVNPGTRTGGRGN